MFQVSCFKFHKQVIKQDVKTATTEAMKAGDNFTVGVLRMLSASITTKEKEKRYKISKSESALPEKELEEKSTLSDEEIVDAISSEIKKRKDAIVLYKQGNRPELAEKEQKEIEILKKYLPEQLSEEELRKIIEESINKVGVSELRDMGKVMADLNPKIKGKADGGEVSRIVKEILTEK